jgi:hypothetical protein
MFKKVNADGTMYTYVAWNKTQNLSFNHLSKSEYLVKLREEYIQEMFVVI